MGRVVVSFAPLNAFGVLDHHVTLPSGMTVYNPVRVISNEAGSEVVFTLRRQPQMSDADFARDAGMVADDLARLRTLMESNMAAIHCGRGVGSGPAESRSASAPGRVPRCQQWIAEHEEQFWRR